MKSVQREIPSFLTRLRNTGIPTYYLTSVNAIINDEESTDFCKLIYWISKQLQHLNNLECSVNQENDNFDYISFSLEVNSLLKELNCSYDILFNGAVNERFLSPSNRILLISFLLGELNAAQILSKNKKSGEGLIIKMKESDTAKCLREIAICLGLSKPPATITPKMYFQKVESKLHELINKHSLQLYLPLFTGTLTEKQWMNLEHLIEELKNDYKSRRIMSMERLNLTLQSFCWDSKIKNMNDKISSISNHTQMLSISPDVNMSDLLSSRQDMLIIEKTSGPSVRKNTKSSINKIIIGAVPDRGGRPDEQQPPPPEIPSWQQNSSTTKSFGTGHRVASSNPPSYNNMENSNSHSTMQVHSYQDNYRNKSNQHFAQTSVNNTSYGNNPDSMHSYQRAEDYGFGGYSTTGGNFQQFGVSPQFTERQQFHGNQRFGRGRYSRGSGQQRRPRGTYNQNQY